MPENNKFILSISCITYNQSAYITDALNGFVMQQTNFPFVAVVIDDASTDGEQEVIKSYLEEHFDHSGETGYKRWETEDAFWIFARHKQNENFHVVAVFLKRNLFKEPEKKDAVVKDWLNTKYIAVCEGDDYWTDPLKLQKQVDFLEAHPECAVAFHRYDILQQEEHIWRKDRCNVYLRPKQDFVEITIPMYFATWVTQPCTMMFRKGVYLGHDKPYKRYKDSHMIFHLLNGGKGYLLNYNGAVYRENKGGIHGRTPILNQSRLAVEVARELYDYNGKTAVLKDNLVNVLDWAIGCEKKYEDAKTMLNAFIWQRFLLTKSIKKALKQYFK